MAFKIIAFWQLIRQLSGDDAYDRYLNHFAKHHSEEGGEPLGKAEFFKQRQDNKWTGINRCC